MSLGRILCHEIFHELYSKVVMLDADINMTLEYTIKSPCMLVKYFWAKYIIEHFKRF